MILLVGLFYGCEQDCTKTAIRKLPNIDERPECSNHIYSNLVLSEDMNFPGNLYVSGKIETNGFDLKIGGRLRAGEVIASDTLRAKWGMEVGKLTLNQTHVESSRGISVETLFGNGSIYHCENIAVSVDTSASVFYFNLCPGGFNNMAHQVQVDCKKNLPYTETDEDGTVWIIVNYYGNE